MSKKMIKRSLALGALMAFVITGSAMAADVTFNKGVYVHNDYLSKCNYFEFEELIADKDVQNIIINSTSGNGITAHYLAGGRVEGKPDNTYVNINKPNSDLTINASDHGIYFYNQSTVDVKDLSIDAGKNAISADGGASAVINANKITLNADGRGILVMRSNEAMPTLTINVDESLTVNSNDHGLRVGDGELNVNAKNAEVNITSVNGNAVKVGTGNVKVMAKSFTANGDVTAEKGIITITSTGDTTINGTVAAGEPWKDKSEPIKAITTIDGKNIYINANGSDGAIAWSGYSADEASYKINLGSENTDTVNINNASYGLFAYGNGTEINVKGKELNIKDTTYGVWVANRSVSTGDNLDGGDRTDDAKLIIGAGTDVIMTNVDCGIVTMSQGTTIIDGNLTIEANDEAIDTRGEATTLINQANDVNKTIKIKGDIVYDYDDHKVDSGVILNLANDKSCLTGRVYNTGEGIIPDGVVTGMTLGLSNGATWTVTGDSFVNTLNGDKGIIAIEDLETVVKIDKNNATNLTVKQADVTADTVENQQAHLDALASAVVDANGSAADTLLIEEGAVVGAVTATVNANGEVGKAVEAVNTVNQAIGEASVNFKAHYRAHMNDMNKRMGELRMANGEAGVWTRMVRGENEFEGAKSQYNQYQLGYDEKLSVDKRWTVGAAVTFAEGSGSFTNGSTEDDSTAFAIYGSKLNNDGTFVDLIARYAHLESDITMGREKADYGTNGYSVSAEFGKRIQQGNGLWIEPQFELTYGNVDGAEYTIAGRNVQVGDMDSIIGRVGFSLGKDIKQGNVYARASYLYDFDGETVTIFSNTSDLTRTIEEDLGGGWWEVGVGANINLSKATYIYADIEKTFGGEIDTNWQWNLGVRYSF